MNIRPELISTTHCDKHLEFCTFLSAKELSLPIGYAVDNQLLAGFSNDLALNYSTQDLSAEARHQLLSQLFKTIWPDISFMMLSELYSSLSHRHWLSAENFFALWGFRLNENLLSISNLILNLPKHFQTWLHEKKVSPQELQILNLLKLLSPDQVEQFYQFINQIAHFKYSRQQGVLFIELILDLLSSEKLRLGSAEFNQIKTNLPDPKNSIIFLQTLLHPHTSKKDQNRQNILSEKNWPKRVDVHWRRQGDLAGIEFKFFISSAKELEKSLSDLEKTKELLKATAQEIWPESQAETFNMNGYNHNA